MLPLSIIFEGPEHGFRGKNCQNATLYIGPFLLDFISKKKSRHII